LPEAGEAPYANSVIKEKVTVLGLEVLVNR